MCINPVFSANGPVRCRKCNQCRDMRLNNYVGRASAEQAASGRTLALTLTYGTSHPHADFLVYADFQKLLKRLRKAEYDVRYIVAGEYGDEKERAHWHAVLFFTGKELELYNKDGKPVHVNPPNTPNHKKVRENWPFWPHGHTYFQPADVKGFRYILKYILGQQTLGRVTATSFGLSKVPILGFSYIYDLAASYALQGHAPSIPNYDVGRASYYMSSSIRDAFLRVYAYRHFSEHGHTPRILPEWVQEYLENRSHYSMGLNQPSGNFHAYYDNDAQQFHLDRVHTKIGAPLVRRYVERENFYSRWVQGPTNTTQTYLVDQDGDFAHTSRPSSFPYDFRDAVGWRRHQYELTRIKYRAKVRLKGLHDPKDSCPCEACSLRRTQKSDPFHQFQTPYNPNRDQSRKASETPRVAANREAAPIREIQGKRDGLKRSGPYLNRGQGRSSG